MSAAADACPAPDTLSRFVDDELTADERLSIENHLDECDDCRSTIAVLARAASAERRSSGDIQGITPEALDDTALAPSVAIRPSRPRLTRGATLGRYVIA